jgi:hypothetical protein
MRARPGIGTALVRFVYGLRDAALGQSPILCHRDRPGIVADRPLGIKAGGEGGCTPALAIVVSAILRALAPLGVQGITMPATPFKLWQAIRNVRTN